MRATERVGEAFRGMHDSLKEVDMSASESLIAVQQPRETVKPD